MVLNVNAEFPQSTTYVLKLRRDAAPAAGRLCGRLEHVTSGRQAEFGSFEELLTCLLRLAASSERAMGEVP